MTRMHSNNENIINNFNVRNTLALEKTVCILQIKEIRLHNLQNIEKESANFDTRENFRVSQRD